MSDFHKKFEEFRENFSKERGLIMAINSVNSKSNSDLKKLYLEYLNSLYLSNRLHYAAFSTEDFSVNSLQFILKGITPLSTAQSQKIFAKPNHKDKYSYLIYWLTNNPEVFAQIAYFYLVSSDISVSDKQFFIFNTFPAVFSSFTTFDDQENAVTFLKTIFLLHFELHGLNFSYYHKFLADLCLSFFIATNPGHFFGVVLKPLLREYVSDAKQKMMVYQKQEGKLVRTAYYETCISFARDLLKHMMSCITLLHDSSRYFLTQLSQITEDQKYMQSFLFDATFSTYLKNNLLNDECLVLKDVCEVIKTIYPQNFMPSKLFAEIQEITKIEEIGDISKFFDSLKLEKITRSNDSVSKAVTMCERSSIYAPKDLQIMYDMTSSFVKEMDKEQAIPQLVDAINALSPLVDTNDDKVVILKQWAGGNLREKVELKPTKTYDDIIDGLSMLDGSNLDYKTGEELADSAILYSGSFMDWMQKLRISTTVENITVNTLDNALKSVIENEQQLNHLSQLLFSAVYFITTDKKQHDEQSLREMNRLVLLKFLPLMKSLYPKEFDFTARDIFQAKDNLKLVFAALDNIIKPMNFPTAHELMISRALFGEYLDALEQVLMFQSTSITKATETLMNNFSEQTKEMENQLSKTHRNLVNQAKELFSMLNPLNQPTRNLGLVIDGMRLLKNFKIEIIAASIAQTKNTAILGFHNFVRTYISDDKIQKVMFDTDELDLIKLFNAAALKLRK